VRACSDSVADTSAGQQKEAWHLRKTRYVAHLGAADQDTLLVSLADKIHNARSILRDLRKPDVGAAVWARFKGSQQDTLWHYRELAKAFAQYRPGQLADELGEIVDALEQA
jgi:(p)ppGpp synthase/HD superfamily hydrolase